MSNFCILRIKKIKTDQNVSSCLAHHLRTRETPNADPEQVKKNWYYPAKKNQQANLSSLENRQQIRRQALAMYRRGLPEKIRKNAVRAVEFMMTFSPEVIQKKDFDTGKFLESCNDWVRKKFGTENVFFTAVHRDETTPHISALVLPKDEKGHLNARKFFGGREKMQALQDDFFEKVGKKYGLERGLKGSRSKHQTVKKFYAKLNETQKELEKYNVLNFSAEKLRKLASAKAYAEEQERQNRAKDKLKRQRKDDAWER